MAATGSRTDDLPVVQLPDQASEVPVAEDRGVLRGIFLLGAPESGCRSVGSWLESSGFAPGQADEGFRIAVSEDRPAGPPTVIPTAWAEFLMAMADGSWQLPPPSDLLLGARSVVVPIFSERVQDAIDCAHGLPVVFSEEHLLPVLPILGSSTLSRFLGILILRNPAAIARTLSAKFDISVAEGLSLWEHYMAAAFSAARQLPMLVAWVDRADYTATLSAETIEALVSPTTAAERVLGYRSPSPEAPSGIDWLDATDGEFRALATRHQIELWDCLTDSANSTRFLQEFPASFERPSDAAVEVLHDGARHRTGRVSKQELLRALHEEQEALSSLSKKSEELLAATNASLNEALDDRDRSVATVNDLMQRLRSMGVTQAEGHRKADRLSKENEELRETVLQFIHDSEELEKVYNSEIWRVGFAVTLPFRRVKETIFGTVRRQEE
jgi:hypothetical protein